jgi:hypothetical protein
MNGGSGGNIVFDRLGGLILDDSIRGGGHRRRCNGISGGIHSANERAAAVARGAECSYLCASFVEFRTVVM